MLVVNTTLLSGETQPAKSPAATEESRARSSHGKRSELPFGQIGQKFCRNSNGFRSGQIP